MNRKVDIAVIKLTDDEFKELDRIIENYNKTLRRSRERSALKRKTEHDTTYRKDYVHLSDYVCGETKMKLSELKDERKQFLASLDESIEDPIPEESQ